jgi:hypothetical protein
MDKVKPDGGVPNDGKVDKVKPNGGVPNDGTTRRSTRPNNLKSAKRDDFLCK